MTAVVDILGTEITEGDVAVIEWTVTDSSGNPYDFTSVVDAWFTLKEDPGDTDAEAVAQYLLSDPLPRISLSSGKVTVTFASGDTTGMASKQYLYYDFQMLTGTDIETPFRGKIQFNKEVTKATDSGVTPSGIYRPWYPAIASMDSYGGVAAWPTGTSWLLLDLVSGAATNTGRLYWLPHIPGLDLGSPVDVDLTSTGSVILNLYDSLNDWMIEITVDNPSLLPQDQDFLAAPLYTWT